MTNQPDYALELIHTKAVRGICKTFQRRPYRRNPDGTMSKAQRAWMQCRPTLDVLWHRPWWRALTAGQLVAYRRAVTAWKAAQS